ncbi:MAG: ABC transporter ATP-binding protein [Desulfofustis sp.]|nr:ABC transporter ATP-binding protein [Desulfofustis sp.]MBT8352896.1 ABC transporter ATP-binding protein [Desulfofustis sp.]NNF46937.1 ABC transporter ATP-binding protein [Desulfofustis sp.]NNK56808.1 ABC transporter ATP-binding protein [Desulfofustis sp.]
MGDIALSTDRLTVNFGTFCAVNNVSLQLKRHSITGLIGPNGAGKTTFFNALTGMLKPSSGWVMLDGIETTGKRPDQLYASGLARTFQIPRPFSRMSVLENVMLAPLAQRGEHLWGATFSSRKVFDQEQKIRQKALEILDFVTLSALVDHEAGRLSGGQTKLLELARVLMGAPSIILLDEPAAGVNPTLTNVLLERIEALNAQGTTFLIIEHDMDFIMSHCNPVIALSAGEMIFEGTPEEAQANTILLDAYLGAQASD